MLDTYFAKVTETLDFIKTTQMDNILQAGALVADTIRNDGIIRPFGTGHSHLIATEMYQRAGGFGPVMPLLEGNLMMHEGGRKSGALERLPGYAAVLLGLHDVQSRDLLVVVSQSGRNAAPVEMAEECKKRGMKTVAITSLAHSKSVSSRTPGGKRLFEVADVVIDNGTPVGDATVHFEQTGASLAPLSTIAGCFIWHAMAVHAAELLSADGVKPPVFMSGNAPGGDLNNVELYMKYKNRILF